MPDMSILYRSSPVEPSTKIENLAVTLQVSRGRSLCNFGGNLKNSLRLVAIASWSAAARWMRATPGRTHNPVAMRVGVCLARDLSATGDLGRSQCA